MLGGVTGKAVLQQVPVIPVRITGRRVARDPLGLAVASVTHRPRFFGKHR